MEHPLCNQTAICCHDVWAILEDGRRAGIQSQVRRLRRNQAAAVEPLADKTEHAGVLWNNTNPFRGMTGRRDEATEGRRGDGQKGGRLKAKKAGLK